MKRNVQIQYIGKVIFYLLFVITACFVVKNTSIIASLSKHIDNVANIVLAQTNSPRFTGNIFVYSCKIPNSVNVHLCEKDQNTTKCQKIPYLSAENAQDRPNAVWLTNRDNQSFYSYSYKISEGISGQDLNLLVGNLQFGNYKISSNPEEDYKPATALIDGKTYYSLPENDNNLIISNSPSSTTRDFTIFADTTCGCPFQSTAFVQLEENEGADIYMTDFDDNSAYGTSNDKQIARMVLDGKEDGPKSKFTNGMVSVPQSERTNYSRRDSYGKDAQASIKLYYDDKNYKIVKQVCKSDGYTDACPNESKQWSKNASQLSDPTIFDGLRVTCGTSLNYGWILKDLNPPKSVEPGVSLDATILTGDKYKDINLNSDNLIVGTKIASLGEKTDLGFGRALLQWNYLPSNAIITKAELRLTVNLCSSTDTSSRIIDGGIYFVKNRWDENTVKWSNQPQADFDNKEHTPITYSYTCSSSHNRDKLNIPIPKEYIQSWIDDGSTNNGLIMNVSGSTYEKILEFYSNQSNTSYYPRLYLEYRNK